MLKISLQIRKLAGKNNFNLFFFLLKTLFLNNQRFNDLFYYFILFFVSFLLRSKLVLIKYCLIKADGTDGFFLSSDLMISPFKLRNRIRSYISVSPFTCEDVEQ